MQDKMIEISAEQIPAWNLLVMRTALKLEAFTGMKHSKHGSVVPMIKGVLMNAGIAPVKDKKKLLEQYETLLRANGLLK